MPRRVGRSSRRALVATLALVSLAATGETGPALVSDRSFGNAGSAVFAMGPQSSRIYDLARAGGNATWALGRVGTDRVIARYRADGLLDAGFGIDGVLILATIPATFEERGFAAAPNGDWIVWGNGPDCANEPCMYRFHADGSLDAAFRNGGAVGAGETAQAISADALALDGFGRLIVVGRASDGRLGIARLHADGAIDATFGNGGSTRLRPIAGQESVGGGVAVDSTGRIVVVSGSFTPTFEYAQTLVVTRLDASGYPDAGFANSGVLVTSAYGLYFGQPEIASDGSIIVGAREGGLSATGRRFIVKVSPAGAVDVGFGASGVAFSPPGPANFRRPGTPSVALDGNGYLVAGASGDQFAVTRIGGAGAVDTQFGSAGVISMDFGDPASIAYAAVGHQDGSWLAAGVSREGLVEDAVTLHSDAMRRLAADVGGIAFALVHARPAASSARFVAPLANGDIAVLGSTNGGGDASRLARLDTTGNVDPGFGRRGSIGAQALGIRDGSFAAIAVAPAGMFAAGRRLAAGAPSNRTALLARLTPGAALDPGYGIGGIAEDPPYPADVYVAVAPDASGGTLALGLSAGVPRLVRHRASGLLDSNFGTGGVLPLVSGGTLNPFVLAQRDGRYIVGGATVFAEELTVRRYLPSGALDTSWAGTGTTSLDFGQSNCLCLSRTFRGALQADDKLVIAGARHSGSSVPDAPVIARLQTNGVLDPSFGSGGMVTLPYAGTSAIDVLVRAGGEVIVLIAVQPGQSRRLVVLSANGGIVADTAIADGYTALASDGPRIFVVGSAGPRASVQAFVLTSADSLAIPTLGRLSVVALAGTMLLLALAVIARRRRAVD